MSRVYQLLTVGTDGTLLDKNAYRDPVLGVMETKNKKTLVNIILLIDSTKF